MTLREAIRELEKFAEQLGDDAQLTMYNRELDIEYKNDPDNNVWMFEFLRGDNEVTIEFD